MEDAFELARTGPHLVGRRRHTYPGVPGRGQGLAFRVGGNDGVEREVVEAFDHKYLNEEVPEFNKEVPTAENICREIYRRLKGFPAARLERVRLEETSKNSFEFDGEIGDREQRAP